MGDTRFKSQIRMTLAVSPDKIDELLNACRKKDVEGNCYCNFYRQRKFHVRMAAKLLRIWIWDFCMEGFPVMKLNAAG